MATKKISITDAIEAFKAFLIDEEKSEYTVKNYISDVNQFKDHYKSTLNPKAFASLKGAAAIVKDYIQQMKQTPDAKPTTTNRKIVALRNFFHFCSIDERFSTEVPIDPTANVYVGKIQGRGQHTVKWLNRAQIETILAAIPQIPKTNNLAISRNRAIILTLANCGLRVGELSELRIGDIDFKKGVLAVRRGKGDKFRIVPIPKHTGAAIREWVNTRIEELSREGKELKESDFLFDSERSAQLSERGVQHMTQILSKISEIPFSPHTLRHSYCKNVADKTGRLEIVADLAGHANINTTRIYTAPSMPELKKVIEDIEFE